MQELAVPLFSETELEAETQYIINRTELLRLKSMGLVQDKLYVYLALKLTYDTTAASVDIEAFCEDWKLTESELAIAIAQLQKKRALETRDLRRNYSPANSLPKAAQLELELF